MRCSRISFNMEIIKILIFDFPNRFLGNFKITYTMMSPLVTDNSDFSCVSCVPCLDSISIAQASVRMRPSQFPVKCSPRSWHRKHSSSTVTFSFVSLRKTSILLPGVPDRGSILFLPMSLLIHCTRIMDDSSADLDPEGSCPCGPRGRLVEPVSCFLRMNSRQLLQTRRRLSILEKSQLPTQIN